MYRAISWFLIHVIMAMAVMIPFNETANAGTSVYYKPAPTGSGTDTASDPTPTAWHNWAAQSSNRLTYPNVANINWTLNGGAPQVPRENRALIGHATFTPAATGQTMQMEMLSGDKWIVVYFEND